MIRRSIGVAALLGLSSVMLASGALAQDDDGPDTDDQIVISGRLLVPEGQTVQTAVIFNGNATIDGTVAETLLVFNGRTEITGTVGERSAEHVPGSSAGGLMAQDTVVPEVQQATPRGLSRSFSAGIRAISSPRRHERRALDGSCFYALRGSTRPQRSRVTTAFPAEKPDGILAADTR